MNLDENTSLFRGSIKGFNKDDVAAFIQKLSRDYAENEVKYKERILALTEENKAKSLEIENLSAESLKKDVSDISISEKNSEIELLNNLLKTATADADKYKDDVNKLLSELRSKEAEIIELKKLALVTESSADAEISAKSGLSEQVAELSLKLEDIKIEKETLALENQIIIEDLKNQLEQNRAKVEDEQKMYENIAAELGAIIYSAKKTAEDVGSKAKSDADELLAKAKSEADDIIARANMRKLALFEETERSTAQLKEKYNYIKAEHNKVIEGFGSITGAYAESLAGIKEAIDNISDNI